jgi:hypothetical protein
LNRASFFSGRAPTAIVALCRTAASTHPNT